MSAEGILQNTWTGASVTVGEDQLKDELLAIQPVARTIKKIAIVGGTAVNDLKMELMVGGNHKGYFQNTHAALENIDHNSDIINTDIYVPPNQRVQLYCRAENAGANNVVTYIQFGPARRSTGGYRRNTYRRRTNTRSRSRRSGGMY